MNEDDAGLNAIEAQLRQKFNSKEWLCYRSEIEGIKSRRYINKSFVEEIKTNIRGFRANKRNSTKTTDYFQNLPLYSGKDYNADFHSAQDRIYQSCLPSAVTYTYEGLGSRIYNSNFTKDGRHLVVTTQNGTSLFKFSDDNKVELSNVISCSNVNWAVTDSDISSDDKFMIHSTLTPNVHIFNLEQASYSGSFTIGNDDQANSNLGGAASFLSLKVFSIKIANDCKQVVAGCGRTIGGAPIQLYDMESNKLKNSIIAHSDDINSVAFINKQDSNIFVSASDDGVCKLWDSRILENNKPVGIFYGHVSGLAYVASKEDDRHFITNSKDQSIKLWDIRKSITDKINYPFLKYDYRYEILGQDHIEEIKRCKKKVDQSLMTFWGHQVHMSLIRCHFSPLKGTNQRYIYTGSYDGRVYIYDTISGLNIACLEPHNTNNGMTVSSTPLIRDCAWHPHAQTIVSTNFFGEIHKWEYSDCRDSELVTFQEEIKDESDQIEAIPEIVTFGRSMLSKNR